MFSTNNTYGSPNLGNNVDIVGDVNFGSEPYLITIGDNTTISFDCAFVTHDAATRVIRNLPGENPETVIYGKINIGKNCFIGCRSVILPNVTIGDNVIIGAGSISPSTWTEEAVTVNLYITGLTIVTLTVVEYLNKLGYNVAVFGFNPNTKEYYNQGYFFRPRYF